MVLYLIAMVSTVHASTFNNTYDNLGRLTQVTYDDGSTITYTYDANGNRLIQDAQPTNTPTPKANYVLWAGTGGSASISTLDSSNNVSTYAQYGPYSGWMPVNGQ
ncbi:MAG: RHS repeat protein [Deltaproteobacteria bacterium]|nr:RHS repeat protein [Deltaproteobacteria bacterium]